MSETKPTPFVSDDYIIDVLIESLNARNLTKIKRQGPAVELAREVRDLYEARLSEVIKERDEAVDVLKRVHSILDLENPESYVNDDRSGAIDTADSIMRKFLTHNTTPSHG